MISRQSVPAFSRAFLPVLACLFLAVQALPAKAADRARLEAFLTVTGFDVALESIALSAEHAPEMLGMSRSDFGSSWSVMAEQVFAPERMHGMALDMLENTLSDELLTHAADFYASDLGARLVEVENASHLADEEMKAETGEALLARYREATPERVELLEALVSAVDNGEHGVRAVQEIQVRFLMAASHAGVLDGEIDEAALRAIMAETAEELRESIAASSLVATAYTYRDFTDEELAAYVDALRQDEMQQVYELMNAIQHEVMADRFEHLADRMAGVHLGEEL